MEANNESESFVRNVQKPGERNYRRILGFSILILFLFGLTILVFSSGKQKTQEEEHDSTNDKKHENDDDEKSYVPFYDHEIFGEHTNISHEFNATIPLEEHHENLKPASPTIDDDEVGLVSFEYYYRLCLEARQKNYEKGTIEYEIASANCGWGYNYKNSTSKYHPWKVYLVGRGFGPSITEFSGCPKSCPHSPLCTIEHAKRPHDVKDANVFVVFQTDAQVMHSFPKQNGGKTRPYRILYYREALMSAPHMNIQEKFDFEMGVHYHSGLIDPTFLRTPNQLWSMSIYPFPKFEFLPLEKRTGGFAISIISHCGTTSLRDSYINQLSTYLGSNRVHRYGQCGDRPLPPKPIENAAKLIAKYKFYLSFENTIQNGYTTEKLYFVLNIPVVPIYYGSLTVPNITNTPSFIKASDFHSPQHLSRYLIHLDSNPREYDRYHEWRFNRNSFSRDYLKTLQNKIAGPEEAKAYKDLPKQYRRWPRTAQCCRLCDENFVKQATLTRDKRRSLVPPRMSRIEINKKFFAGQL